MTYCSPSNWDHFNRTLQGSGWSRTLQARELNAAYHQLDDLEWKKALSYLLSFTPWGRRLYSRYRLRYIETQSTIWFLRGPA